MSAMITVEGKAVSWQKIVSAYAKPDLRKSVWQIINTLIPFFALFYLSMRSVDVSLWLTVPLAILTAGFMIRAFIIFHDCGHGSFFKSQRANDWTGIITGLLAFTPYYRWKRHAEWDYFKASMQGSSFYKLPALLQWFTGNIGFHHIHHLGPRIPNYNLPKAYKENPIFHVKPLTLRSSLKCLKWRLYDEANRRLVGWDALKQYRPKTIAA